VLDLTHELIPLSGFEVSRDVKIKVVRLRSKEKLFEELLIEEEINGELENSG